MTKTKWEVLKRGQKRRVNELDTPLRVYQHSAAILNSWIDKYEPGASFVKVFTDMETNSAAFLFTKDEDGETFTLTRERRRDKAANRVGARATLSAPSIAMALQQLDYPTGVSLALAKDETTRSLWIVQKPEESNGNEFKFTRR